MMEDLTVAPLSMEEVTQEKFWKPSKMEAFRNHEISIKFLNRGVIVTVGCKQIAYESVESFMKSFTAYMEDPFSVQESWLKFFKEQDQIK
jgi:hypothetical protein